MIRDAFPSAGELSDAIRKYRGFRGKFGTPNQRKVAEAYTFTADGLERQAGYAMDEGNSIKAAQCRARAANYRALAAEALAEVTPPRKGITGAL